MHDGCLMMIASADRYIQSEAYNGHDLDSETSLGQDGGDVDITGDLSVAGDLCVFGF